MLSFSLGPSPSRYLCVYLSSCVSPRICVTILLFFLRSAMRMPSFCFLQGVPRPTEASVAVPPPPTSALPSQPRRSIAAISRSFVARSAWTLQSPVPQKLAVLFLFLLKHLHNLLSFPDIPGTTRTQNHTSSTLALTVLRLVLFLFPASGIVQHPTRLSYPEVLSICQCQPPPLRFT
jgi:hypothetical protein